MMINSKILSGQSGAASFATPWIPVGAAGLRDISMTIDWAAGGAGTAGTLSFEGTDDPTQGAAVALTVGTFHGTFPTVGTGAANALVALSDCPGWVRAKYTRSGGGAAGQFNVSATVT